MAPERQGSEGPAPLGGRRSFGRAPRGARERGLSIRGDGPWPVRGRRVAPYPRGAVLTALGFVWTLPNTLLGLLLGLCTFQVPRVHRGVVLFDRRARGWSLVVRRFGYAAQTFGFVMIGAERIEGPLFDHEREHVRQYRIWGPLFLPAYLLLFVFYGYRRHPFEVAAVRRARAAGRAVRR